VRQEEELRAQEIDGSGGSARACAASPQANYTCRAAAGASVSTAWRWFDPVGASSFGEFSHGKVLHRPFRNRAPTLNSPLKHANLL
jgi:hypothetical protein